MESNIDPDEARSTLAFLDDDGARLIERVVTPWWYHPILAAIVAAIIISQALPGAWGITLLPLAIIAIPLLMLAYKKHSGVATTQPAGPRSKRLMLMLMAVVVLALVSTLVVKLTDSSPWWALIPAAIAAVATVLLGRRYDAVLRQELALPVSARR